VARVPDDVDLRTAAAVMLQGLTALSLVAVEARVSPGQTVLVHSAAGGTGSLIVQVARHAGARVLGLASTEEKVAAALRVGASAAGTYPEGGFADWVREQTDGRGVDVIFDAVGGPTFADDLDSLAVRGRLIVYGRSGGPFPPLDPARLSDGCLSLTYSRLSYYTGTFADFQERAAGLFDLVSKGAVAPLELTVLPLAEATVAHAALAARTSLGKHVLDLAEESAPR
jgi:NADPH2:quinone reductase